MFEVSILYNDCNYEFLFDRNSKISNVFEEFRSLNFPTIEREQFEKDYIFKDTEMSSILSGNICERRFELIRKQGEELEIEPLCKKRKSVFGTEIKIYHDSSIYVLCYFYDPLISDILSRVQEILQIKLGNLFSIFYCFIDEVGRCLRADLKLSHYSSENLINLELVNLLEEEIDEEE